MPSACTIAPSVSVIIATRNRAKGLARVLESVDVAQQTACIDGEILVVNNGSTDDTATLLERWVAVGTGRVHLQVPQPGKSRALNHALPVARAPVLAFTDDDVEV